MFGANTQQFASLKNEMRSGTRTIFFDCIFLRDVGKQWYSGWYSRPICVFCSAFLDSDLDAAGTRAALAEAPRREPAAGPRLHGVIAAAVFSAPGNVTTA